MSDANLKQKADEVRELLLDTAAHGLRKVLGGNYQPEGYRVMVSAAVMALEAATGAAPAALAKQFGEQPPNQG